MMLSLQAITLHDNSFMYTVLCRGQLGGAPGGNARLAPPRQAFAWVAPRSLVAPTGDADRAKMRAGAASADGDFSSRSWLLEPRWMAATTLNLSAHP